MRVAVSTVGKVNPKEMSNNPPKGELKKLTSAGKVRVKWASESVADVKRVCEPAVAGTVKVRVKLPGEMVPAP